MKSNNLFPLFLILLFSIIFSQCTASQNSQNDMEELQKTISNLNNAWDGRDVDKILELYTEDATFLAPNQEMIKGKQALREILPLPDSVKVELIRENVDLRIEGNFAFEIVNQNTTVYINNQKATFLLQKYLHIWKKQKDGTWRVFIDMYNLREPQDN